MQPNPHLRQLITKRQIVQQYPPPPEERNYPQSTPSERMFFEDQIFDELERTAIVEDYMSRHQYSITHDYRMDQEPVKMEEEPYEQLTHNVRSRLSFTPQKMMDSASSGRELPSRGSSISSLSGCEQKVVPSPLSLLGAKTQSFKMQTFQQMEKHVNRGQGDDWRRGVLRARRQVGSSTQKRQRLNKIKKVQDLGCNCRKSKCLKMYCQCFNLQILCSQNCNCVGCGNMAQNQHHQKAVLDALTRNPKAFAEDVQQIPTVFNLGLELSQVRKGCKCKKTKCRKKYCECYNSGQMCGIFCQCEGCANCQPAQKP